MGEADQCSSLTDTKQRAGNLMLLPSLHGCSSSKEKASQADGRGIYGAPGGINAQAGGSESPEERGGTWEKKTGRELGRLFARETSLVLF